MFPLYSRLPLSIKSWRQWSPTPGYGLQFTSSTNRYNDHDVRPCGKDERNTVKKNTKSQRSSGTTHIRCSKNSAPTAFVQDIHLGHDINSTPVGYQGGEKGDWSDVTIKNRQRHSSTDHQNTDIPNEIRCRSRSRRARHLSIQGEAHQSPGRCRNMQDMHRHTERHNLLYPQHQERDQQVQRRPRYGHPPGQKKILKASRSRHRGAQPYR